jgi:hypothetical protein
MYYKPQNSRKIIVTPALQRAFLEHQKRRHLNNFRAINRSQFIVTLAWFADGCTFLGTDITAFFGFWCIKQAGQIRRKFPDIAVFLRFHPLYAFSPPSSKIAEAKSNCIIEYVASQVKVL